MWGFFSSSFLFLGCFFFVCLFVVVFFLGGGGGRVVVVVIVVVVFCVFFCYLKEGYLIRQDNRIYIFHKIFFFKFIEQDRSNLQKREKVTYRQLRS